MRNTATLLGIILTCACGSFADDAKPASKPGAVRPGDLLAIDLHGIIADDVFARVSADCTLPLPYLAAVDVAGKTTAEIEPAVAKLLHDNQIDSHPIVIVRRLQVGKFEPGPLKPFDLVRVDVMDLEGNGARTSVVRRIAADGTFGLPWVRPVTIAGLTDAAAVKAVAAKLEDQKIVSHPVVMVTPIERAPAAGGDTLPDLPTGPVDEATRIVSEPSHRGK